MTKAGSLHSELYRGYEIKQSEFGWFNIRRQSFSVASFHTLDEARKAIDEVCQKKLSLVEEK